MPRRAQRMLTISGPLTLSGEVGAVQCAQRAQRLSVGVALPDDVDVAHRQVDRLAGSTLLRHVEQHAVAHVDRVVQADEPAGRAVRAREVLEHALAADAGVGVLAGRRRRRRRLGRALVQDADERIDAAGREGDDARAARRLSATSAGTWTFIAQVSRALPAAPNLRPAMKTTFGSRRAAPRPRRASSRSHAMRLDAAACELLRQRRARRSGRRRSRACPARRAWPGAPASAPSCRRRRAP